LRAIEEQAIEESASHSRISRGYKLAEGRSSDAQDGQPAGAGGRDETEHKIKPGASSPDMIYRATSVERGVSDNIGEPAEIEESEMRYISDPEVGR